MARAEDVEIWPDVPGIEFKTIRQISTKAPYKVNKGLPTASDAILGLQALAAKLGANAVVDSSLVRTVASGSYGGIAASGLAVLLPEDVPCAACAETIKRKAKKCRFCGEVLPPGPQPIEVQEPPSGLLATASAGSPNERAGWATWKKVGVGIFGSLVLLFIFAGVMAEQERAADPVGFAKRQAEREAEVKEAERIERDKLAAKEQAEIAETKAAALEQESKRKSGFHCLSGWDGSNRSAVEEVKKVLRNPDSFKHVETKIAPNANGSHALVMTYRAENGFGGLNVEQAAAVVDHNTCQATLVLAE